MGLLSFDDDELTADGLKVLALAVRTMLDVFIAGFWFKMSACSCSVG